jgi:hypothetical protein
MFICDYVDFRKFKILIRWDRERERRECEKEEGKRGSREIGTERQMRRLAFLEGKERTKSALAPWVGLVLAG